MELMKMSRAAFRTPAFLLSALIIFSILLPASALSASALSASALGTCRDFDVVVEYAAEGCWDVKIDAPGEVLHKDGWKDSFFYVQNALCNADKAVVRLRLATRDNITATVKLRQNNTILEQPFEILQRCVQAPGADVLFPVVILVIIVLLGLVWWYRKK